jgi:hypothetical protein
MWQKWVEKRSQDILEMMLKQLGHANSDPHLYTISRPIACHNPVVNICNYWTIIWLLNTFAHACYRERGQGLRWSETLENFCTYEFSHNWQQSKHNIVNSLFIYFFFLGISTRCFCQKWEKFKFVLTFSLYTKYLYTVNTKFYSVTLRNYDDPSKNRSSTSPCVS